VAYQMECEERGRSLPTCGMPWLMPGWEGEVDYRTPYTCGSVAGGAR
jgi:hypothetical protein